MKSNTIQQIADRINACLEYYPFRDNLEEIEVFTKDNGKEKSLFLYWSNFVTMNMINAINEELGTDMNYVFHHSDRLNTVIPLDKVIIR